MKLHLGCFHKKLPDFVNVDIREDVNPDVVDDAFTLKKFENNSVDLIYTCHMLEHLNYEQVKEALKRWYEVLKPSGILRIAVPDFEALCKRYIYTGNIQEVKHSVSGSQKHDFDYHYNIFDEQSLTQQLEDIGFEDVHRYDWWKTEHSHVDDFSHAYLPSDTPDIALSHGRLLEGKSMLISLNVEGRKP